MKNTAIIQKAFVIASIIALTSAAAYAHSSHDHSKLSLKWHLSDAAKIKVMTKMASENWSGSVGLSKLDQKILQSYGIHIGSTFNTTLGDKLLTIKRISMGFRVMEVEGLTGMTYVPEVPMRDSNIISKISTNAAHSGHDHKILSKEWIFPSKAEAKIARSIQNGKYPVTVGLSSIERKAMEAYGIKNGNIFRAQVAGQDLMVKRSSSGIRVNKASTLEVASLNESGAM